MNICVYGAASEEIDANYKTAVTALCAEMARRGHTLVFGGGCTGLMGAAARGAASQNGEIIGIVPSFFRVKTIERLFTACTEVIYTDTMYERKQKMEELSDAFIITPGGIGTFDEFFGVLTNKQLGRHGKPIAIFNVLGFYEGLEAFMGSAIEREFIKPKCRELYKITDDVAQLLDYIENSEPVEFNILDVKAN